MFQPIFAGSCILVLDIDRKCCSIAALYNKICNIMVCNLVLLIFSCYCTRGRYHKNVFEVGSLEVMDKNCSLTFRWNSTYSVILLPY